MPGDIVTTINYYDDPGDGSPPTPVYVGKYGCCFSITALT
jgi:hypothetical protein